MEYKPVRFVLPTRRPRQARAPRHTLTPPLTRSYSLFPKRVECDMNRELWKKTEGSFQKVLESIFEEKRLALGVRLLVLKNKKSKLGNSISNGLPVLRSL